MGLSASEMAGWAHRSPGYGDGDGFGYGYGFGSGDGYGYGFGYGYGYGYGSGFGYGYGYGSGGYGYGSGYGATPQDCEDIDKSRTATTTEDERRILTNPDVQAGFAEANRQIEAWRGVGSANTLREQVEGLMNNYGWPVKEIRDEIDYAIDHRDETATVASRGAGSPYKPDTSGFAAAIKTGLDSCVQLAYSQGITAGEKAQSERFEKPRVVESWIDRVQAGDSIADVAEDFGTSEAAITNAVSAFEFGRSVCTSPDLVDAARGVVAARQAVLDAVTPGHPNALNKENDPDGFGYNARFTAWHTATSDLAAALSDTPEPV